MKPKDAKLLAALALIMAVAIAPVSTAAFAQTEDLDAVDEFEEIDEIEIEETSTDETNTDEESDDAGHDYVRDQRKELRDEMKEKFRELKEDRAEKIREFKERMGEQYKDRIRTAVEHDVRPYEFEADREPDLYFHGSTDGWALIGGYAYEALIDFKEGEAYHVRGNMWKVHVSEGEIQIGDRKVPIELWGKATGHRLTLHGVAELGDQQIRIGLGGNYAPTQKDNVFALSLTKLGYHTENNSGRIHLAQVGEVFVESNQELLDPVIPESAPIEVPEIFS